DEPGRVTASQKDSWARDFDNWAICDTVCFALFDRTPHAWTMARKWFRQRDEFVKRAGFALVWGLSVHDKSADDERFLEALEWMEKAATDDRNFVKGGEHGVARRREAQCEARGRGSRISERLAASPDKTARWIGKDALRELSRPRRKLPRSAPAVSRHFSLELR